MIEKIYSQVDPTLILASILSAADQGRVDASGVEEILQVSVMRMPKDKKISPHSHLPTVRQTQGTQEAWIIISGQVAVTLYDLNQQPVHNSTLTPGTAMVLFRGGHTFTTLTDNVVLFEVKNGPYFGPALDSVKIDQ